MKISHFALLSAMLLMPLALANALDESRAAFDRANQAAAEAFKRAFN